ncbi:MAG: Tat pathway signal protein [Armatimonadetes bacterium]|nr:Tat pathway signal protein [Armatimonadota bacterium]
MTNCQLIWAELIHLSTNMWIDREDSRWDHDHVVSPHLRFDSNLWNELVGRMVEAGVNMVVLDLGDAIQYASHPEIAVEGAWTVDRMKQEIARLRELGIEPNPKLNFSACHDAWLGPYSRMLSTDTYYAVCKDLIGEIIGIFDTPRFFHLGMDEETYAHQQHFEYVTIRQFDLWWHDIYFLFKQVEDGGVRPWVWSDYLWHHPEVFWDKMPKSVLQSNWYYGEPFNREDTYVKAYLDLEEHGYDQVPTGANWSCDTNYGDTVKFARENIAPERLKGFLQTIWRQTTPRWREKHVTAIEQVAAARKDVERSSDSSCESSREV